MKPGFFDYFNNFMQWCEETKPTDKTAILYIKLLHTFNRRGWSEWICVDIPLLMVLANTPNVKNACRARDKLVQAGLLEYKPGKKGKPSEYQLLVRGASGAKAPDKPAEPDSPEPTGANQSKPA